MFDEIYRSILGSGTFVRGEDRARFNRVESVSLDGVLDEKKDREERGGEKVIEVRGWCDSGF